MLRKHAERGFTLIELMIVVAIIAILAAVAIPQYRKFQLRAKTSEAKANVGAVRTAEEGWAAEHDEYLIAGWYPGNAGSSPQDWDPANAGSFTDLGFKPAGQVYYDYGIASGDATGDLTGANPQDGDPVSVADGTTDITIVARGDLDGDGNYSYYGTSDEDAKIFGPDGDDF